MKPAWAVIVALSLAGCGASPPKDCAVVIEQFGSCLNKLGEAAHRDVMLGCIPYSESERIAGTWARDFEFNEFYEGRRVAPDQAWQFRERSTKLLTGDSPHKDAAGVPQATVSWVEFEGRRPLCDLVPEERWVIVDRVLSEQFIEARPSERYSAPSQ